ncbi:MAG: MFS transporter [Proteobacteria bacterium]|nr:MFS transporter [Pseudomonadota bacterium]
MNADAPRSFRVVVVLLLTGGLMVVDFAARSSVTALYPALAAEWGVGDAALGLLAGVVALCVAVLAFPLSLVVDRVGAVRCITVMALVWSVAMIAGGFAASYGQLLTSRVLVGVGEASYGTAGGALFASLFAADRRAAMLGAFNAMAAVGTVLGVAFAGAVAAVHGWRAPLLAIGVAGAALALAFAVAAAPLHRRTGLADGDRPLSWRTMWGSLRLVFVAPGARLIYLAGGLQLFAAGALSGWLPAFLARTYGLDSRAAATRAAALLLCTALGMVIGGFVADRVGRGHPARRLVACAVYAGATCVLLGTAFAGPPGTLQITLMFVGALFAAAHLGAAAAELSERVPVSMRATGFAALAIAGNLVGLAPAPVVVGALAPRIGLADALALAALPSAFAAPLFALAARARAR